MVKALSDFAGIAVGSGYRAKWCTVLPPGELAGELYNTDDLLVTMRIIFLDDS